jgi:hypothetical protein
LRGKDRLAVFTCGVCANLSGTGGYRGLRFLKKSLRGMGKEVVLARCIPACCAVEIMKQAVRINADRLSRCDALVVASCAAGVKSAVLASPGIPVVAAADSVGSVPVSRREDPVADSKCTNCGHCVITFTGGICPLSECPAGSKYGPCAKFTGEDGHCVLEPGRACIWVEIEKRGDLEALRELKEIHRRRDEERLPSQRGRESPSFLKKLSGYLVARAGWFGRFVPFVD